MRINLHGHLEAGRLLLWHNFNNPLLGHENRVSAATLKLKKRLKKSANDCDMLCC